MVDMDKAYQDRARPAARLTSRTAKEKGAALIITFIFMVSLTIITSAYLFMVTYGTRNVNAQVNNAKAVYLADAGLNKAVWYLTNTAPDGSTDGSWRTTAYPAVAGANPTDPQQESLGSGVYVMWVETSGSNIMVTARGTVNNIARTVRETVTLTAGVPEAFNYAQFSVDNIDFDDSDGTVTGNIASGDNVDNESGMTITGTVTEDSTVAMPTADLASYAAIATTTVTGNRTFTAGTYSGIWYVSGNATLRDGVTFNGTLIAGGNIVLTNVDNFTSTPTSNYPALVAGGDVRGDNMTEANITGLIFAADDITIDDGEDNTVNGSLISGDDFSIQDGADWSITYDADLASNPPPYFSDGSAGSATGNNWKEI
jgi:Tfp pilus assembly protein PilX